MKKKLIFDFYSNYNEVNDIYNRQHIACIKHFKKHIDEIQINVIYESYFPAILNKIQTFFIEELNDCNFVITFKYYQGDINFREKYPIFNDIVSNVDYLAIFMNNFTTYIYKNLQESEEDILLYICFQYYECFHEHSNLNHCTQGTSVAYSPIVIGNFKYEDVYLLDDKILYIQDDIFIVNCGRYVQHLSHWLIENKDIRKIIKFPFFYEYKYRMQPLFFFKEFDMKTLMKFLDKDNNKDINNYMKNKLYINNTI